MKRAYYMFFSIGVVAIFFLQTLYIRSLYQNFLLVEQQNIEDSIYEAIDLELHHREVKMRTLNAEVEYKTSVSDSRITFDQMPKELQVAMSEFLATVPSPQYKWVDIRDLIDSGIIRSKGDLETQQQQDCYREDGKPLNIHILDSLFKSRVDRNYKSNLCLLDENECVACIEGDSVEYNHTTRKFQIGLKGMQSIVAQVDIIPSYFIKTSILTLVTSFLIVVLSLSTLVYLITVLRRQAEELKRRERNINGVIHDLKSPLVGVASMLDLYHLMENDADKKEILRRNKQSVTLLCSKIDGLLIAAKDKIEINKNFVTLQQLQDRVEILIEGLRIKYSTKNTTIKTTYKNLQKLNIDLRCFDSIITNLVENAIKYSKQDVEVIIDITRYNNQLYINVSDNGIGIDKKEYKRIFDHLYQISETNANGYGIGLTYVKAIARAHGGEAKLVVSEIGVGSKFEVDINVK